MVNEYALRLESLFENELSVPSYQRAYAWEEKQLQQFYTDMLDMNMGEYYYGHFILEGKEKKYEVIDGQQRLTTFVLFMIICDSKNPASLTHQQYIDKFKTVEYDVAGLTVITQNIALLKDKKVTLAHFGIKENDETRSLSRILFALKYFDDLFETGKLKIEKISEYIQIFLSAQISIHITQSKSVAVQIFELQNTRGVQLNTIEKVKSKLMKAIYIHGDNLLKDEAVKYVQNCFASIYKMEEKVSATSFRGNLTLEDILIIHLRIIEDGSKLKSFEFSTPSLYGNQETIILEYLNTQILNKTENAESSSIINYIKKLSSEFEKTTKFICENLPQLDCINSIIGDLCILDKNQSIQLFLILYYLNKSYLFEDISFLQKWEKFLFTRDLHNNYHSLKKRDDFEMLFKEIAFEPDKTVQIIDKYLQKGFRADYMENNSLPLTVTIYLRKYKNDILNNSYNWWSEKVAYVLYKYEKETEGFEVNIKDLRKILKKGKSIEHILPQSWEWEWIKKGMKEDELETFNKRIASIINGFGNLLLLTGDENSSEGNKHPSEKFYDSCSGGSYCMHNKHMAKVWADHNNWENIIVERGEKIYNFMLKNLITEYVD